MNGKKRKRDFTSEYLFEDYPKKRRQVTPDYITHNIHDSPKQREFPYIECDNFIILSNKDMFKRFLKKIKNIIK